jgi:hypothetical protein
MTQLTFDLSESDTVLIHIRARDAITDGEYYGDLDYAIECEWRYFEDELEQFLKETK